MSEYETINDEIKKFLTLSNNNATKENVKINKNISRENLDELISILTDLQKTYSDIYAHLTTNNNEGIKDLLNSEIKMSLVCENLMKVLKDVAQERKEMAENEDKKEEMIKKLIKEKESAEIRIGKLESDNDFINRGNQELTRIIKDQKSKINECREKVDLEKRNTESFKTINQELETLRIKAMEKCGIYEKEIGVLKEHLQSRDEGIKKAKLAAKKEEKEREILNNRIIELEKNNETLKKKVEMKDNALSMCNAELSNLISKGKKMESDLESQKEKASYYERLYNSTNTQNNYLNNQLAKMIGTENIVSPPILQETLIDTTAIESSVKSKESDKVLRKRIRKYRRKLEEVKDTYEKTKDNFKDYELTIERLKAENTRLQEERTKALLNYNSTTNELIKKLESLMNKNKEYQSAIFDLKKEAGIKVRNNEADESFKTVYDGADFEKKQNNFIINDYKLYNSKKVENIVKERNESPNNLKVYKLENDYEIPTFNTKNVNNEPEKNSINDIPTFKYKNKNASNKIKGSNNSKIPTFKYNNKDEKEINNTNLETKSINLNLPDSFYSKLANNKNNYKNLEKNSDTDFYKNDDIIKSKKINEDVISISSDDTSLSPKTVHTTSTLNDMLKRTDELQKRFKNLEEQLNTIKKSDKVEPEKIQDQLKAYSNYYYSDNLDMTNTENII